MRVSTSGESVRLARSIVGTGSGKNASRTRYSPGACSALGRYWSQIGEEASVWKFQRRHQARPSNWRHDVHVTLGLERSSFLICWPARSPGKDRSPVIG